MVKAIASRATTQITVRLVAADSGYTHGCARAYFLNVR